MEESLIKRVVASIKCVTCGQHHETDDINVLSHQRDLWFLSVFCPSCHTRFLVAAVINEGTTPELITDLTGAELDSFSNAGKVTANEVLDMHNLLRDFDGDLFQLLSQK